MIDIFGKGGRILPNKSSGLMFHCNIQMKGVIKLKNSKNQLASMWYHFKKPIALLLALFLAVSNAVTPAFAEDSNLETVIVTAKYGQTEARKMLQMINDFRTGNDAWCRNMDNEIVPITGLEPLVYDYTLEQYAMQRAMEIAIYWGHQRPDGTMCESISVSRQLHGENIAGGQTSAEKAFVAWQET
ncbi:MAG: CAP domain-containing protein, partial [Oscillospiraceae bacterium]|nr:CAP domain-containing protein [Oscillospiraceae bacterium]